MKMFALCKGCNKEPANKEMQYKRYELTGMSPFKLIFFTN